MNFRTITHMKKLPLATLPERNSPTANSYGSLHSWQRACSPWYRSLRQAFPPYIAIHIGFVVISCVSVLYSGPLTPIHALPFNTLWNSWKRWDAFHFISIASQGYTRTPNETAYFPLYPLLARIGAFFTHSVYVSGLLISNISGLVMLVVLYRLVEEDFGKERATRTILYLSCSWCISNRGGFT